MERGKRRRESAGFTLIEVLMVVVFVAWAAMAAMLLGRKVEQEMKTQEAQSQAREIASRVSGRFALFPNYGLLKGMSDYSWLSGAGAKSMEEGGVSRWSVAGPWGKIFLEPESLSAQNDSWSVAYSGVPLSGCSRLVSGASGSFYSTEVNGVSSKASFGPVDPSEAAELCNKPSNMVKFKSDRIAQAGMGVPVAQSSRRSPSSSLPAWSPTSAVAWPTAPP